MQSIPTSTLHPGEFHPAGSLPQPGAGAYELKFMLGQPVADSVAAWAQERLRTDPHAGPHGTYAIRSVYLDTPALDVYHRRAGFTESKYRVRRYGEEPWVFLEQKSRAEGWVRKRRTRIRAAELRLLEEDGGEDWAGAWFRRRLTALDLRPHCRVAYRRLACVGETEGQPVRLTLDRQLRCAPAAGPDPAAAGEERELEGLILELKFRERLPRLFHDLIQEFGLAPTSASKYRRAVELWLPD